MRKANFPGYPFFTTWSVNEFVLWETFEEGTPLLERRRWHKDVVVIKRIEEVRRRKIEEKLKKFLKEFLAEDFRQRLRNWFTDQRWFFDEKGDDFNQVARLSVISYSLPFARVACSPVGKVAIRSQEPGSKPLKTSPLPFQVFFPFCKSPLQQYSLTSS